MCDVAKTALLSHIPSIASFQGSIEEVSATAIIDTNQNTINSANHWNGLASIDRLFKIDD